MKGAVFFCLLGSAAAFAPAVMRPAVMRPTMAAPVQMSLDPVTAADSASHATQLLALALPIPQFNPAKAFIMMFSNILIICTMSIQGTPHDEMVESFGITWLLAGTSLGHIVGAGAILGCTAAGFLA